MSTKIPELKSDFSQAQDREDRADKIAMADINSEHSPQATKKTPCNQWDEKSIAVARKAIDEQMGLRR